MIKSSMKILQKVFLWIFFFPFPLNKDLDVELLGQGEVYV